MPEGNRIFRFGLGLCDNSLTSDAQAASRDVAGKDGMEERAVAGPSGERYAPRRTRALALQVGPFRFPILTLEEDSCTIEPPMGPPPRGHAGIFDGERLMALCLITLAAPEGRTQRVLFKSRIEARLAPPADYAP
jgi:hypothetical protein